MTEERQAQESPTGARGGAAAERVTFWVTTAIKLAGLVIAVNEALFQPSPHDAVVLGLAGLMMAGAQALESSVQSLLGGGKK